MSVVAEFAAQLHKKYPAEVQRDLTPLALRSKTETLKDIQVAIFDIYGTVINYWDESFRSEEEKQLFIKDVFKRTAEYFGFVDILEKIDPSKLPEETLYDFYHGLIAMKHEEGRKSGKTFPEIRVDELWNVILSILINNGYNLDDYLRGTRKDTAMCIAYFYNFFALKRGFFPDVISTLKELKANNIKLGIISNAQFYTPIDLTLFLRDQDDKLVDYLELFEPDFTFFSYEYGVAKPSGIFYDRLFDALYEHSVLPEQTVFIGNDLLLDIKSAQDVGLKAALFTGKKESTFLHKKENQVFADITFASFPELLKKISFYAGEKV